MEKSRRAFNDRAFTLLVLAAGLILIALGLWLLFS
jgi:hypothetical protein